MRRYSTYSNNVAEFRLAKALQAVAQKIPLRKKVTQLFGKSMKKAPPKMGAGLLNKTGVATKTYNSLGALKQARVAQGGYMTGVGKMPKQTYSTLEAARAAKRMGKFHRRANNIAKFSRAKILYPAR